MTHHLAQPSKPFELEERYVRDVYDQLAPHIADPKYRAWPKVRQFILSQPRHSLVADIGCGGGKYFSVTDRVCFIGADVCQELLRHAQGKAKRCDLAQADTLCLPFRDGLFDALISVSVIHHLTTEERRLKAVQEMARVLRPGGRLMIYVWAMEQAQRQFCAQDVLVPWHIVRNKPEKSGSMDSVAGCETDPKNMIEVDGDDEKLDRIMRETVPMHPISNGSVVLEDSWSTALGRKFSALMPTFSPRVGRRGTVPCEDPPPPIPAPIPPVKMDAPPVTWRKRDSLVSGLARFSPMLGRKLAEAIGAKEPLELELESWAATLVAEGLQSVLESLASEEEKARLAQGAARLEGRKLHLSISQELAAAAEEAEKAADESFEDSAAEDLRAEGNELSPVTEQPEEEEEDRAYYRYYHVFREEELLKLVAKVPSLSVTDSYYDHANWCVIAERT